MFKAPRGTRDILPDEVERWRRLEGVARDVFETYGYSEIRTPVFEETTLFVRGLGETTDIVEKEMYTMRKGEGAESITLRPEATAPVVRAYLEHSLHKKKQFQKLYYIGPMFRYERPQAGRQRQFHHLGVEALGSRDPALDAESIVMVQAILKGAGIADSHVRVNAAGSPRSRDAYRAVLREQMGAVREELCEDCRRRYERNIFRILDCKKEQCRQIARTLPPITESLVAEDGAHFEAVLRILDGVGVSYEVDGLLVRGLDYYTHTIFEVSSDKLGAQDAVAGGGRYDCLVREFGGPDIGAVGFAMGMERAILLMADATSGDVASSGAVDVYVAITARDQGLHEEAWKVAQALRRAGITCDLDYEMRSLKAQMKEANKLGAKYAAILGPDERAEGVVTLRDMTTKREQKLTPEAVVKKLAE